MSTSLGIGLGLKHVRGKSGGIVPVSLSGTVTLDGSPLSGVTITSVALGNKTTNGSGVFSYTGVTPDTAYTITPSLEGYTFTPSNRSGTLSTSVSNADFTAAVASSFAPTDLAQLAAWYDASDSCLTGGSPSTNGQEVEAVNDKGAGNLDLSAGTGPSYVASGINGLGTMQFDGTATIQNFTGFVYDVHHILAVIKVNSIDRDIIGSNEVSGAGQILMQVDGGGNLKGHLWTDAGAQAIVHGTTLSTNDIVIVEQRVNATHIGVAVNGGAFAETALSGTKGGNSRPIVLGSRYNDLGAYRWNGQIAEVVVCIGSDLTTQERTDCYDYLYNKWIAPPASYAILMETGDAILTESSDRLRKE